MSDPEQDDLYDDGSCGNCGGEGLVYDCFDGFCMDAESGCDDCARRCDWCNPLKPTPETAALRQILAEALDATAQQKEAE
jgi:hypothetical protein